MTQELGGLIGLIWAAAISLLTYDQLAHDQQSGANLEYLGHGLTDQASPQTEAVPA